MLARDLLSISDGSLVTLPYRGEWLAGRLMKVVHNTYSGVINVWWKVDRLGLVHATLDPEMSLFPQDHEEEPKATQTTEGTWLIRRKGAIVELDNETYQVLFG